MDNRLRGGYSSHSHFCSHHMCKVKVAVVDATAGEPGKSGGLAEMLREKGQRAVVEVAGQLMHAAVALVGEDGLEDGHLAHVGDAYELVRMTGDKEEREELGM